MIGAQFPKLALFAIGLAMSGCLGTANPPPIYDPPNPSMLLGCELSPPNRPVHCPPAPCTNSPPAVPGVPFGCPGTGVEDVVSADVAEAYMSFYQSLQTVQSLGDSGVVQQITDDQKKFDSEVPVIDF